MWWVTTVITAIFLAAMFVRMCEWAFARRAEEHAIQFGLRAFDQSRRASRVVGIGAIPLNILTRARHEREAFYIVRRKNGVYSLSRNAAKYEGRTERYTASDIEKILSGKDDS